MYKETKLLSPRGYERYRVRTPEDLRKVCQLASDAGICGIDSETYSTDPTDPDGALDPHKNGIRLVQISIPGDPPTAYLISVPQVKDMLAFRQLLLDPAVVKVGHNLQFENQIFMKHFDAFVENGFDTFLASRMFQPFVKKLDKITYPEGWSKDNIRHNLGATVKRYLGVDLDKEEQKSDWSREKLTPEQIAYAYSDAEILLPLHDVLHTRLSLTGQLPAAQIEFDAVPAVAMMRNAGWKVDVDLMEDIRDAATRKRQEIKEALISRFPARQLNFFEEKPINLDSPKQVKVALEDKYGVKLDSRDKANLLLLKATKPDTGTDVDLLIQYGGLRNIKDTAREVLREIHPITGRVHADIFQIGQHQHRMAVRRPNWQKVPRSDSFGQRAPDIFKYSHNMREPFVPEDGFLFAISDYSGNQMRIMAELANVATMIEAFINDLDVHRMTAARMLGRDYEDIGPNSVERQKAKTQGFALLFGAMYARFRMQMLEDTGELIPEHKIRKMRDGFFNVYPELLNYYDKQRLLVAQEHKIYTPRGRIIPFYPGVEYWNEPVNFPVSATEVDGMKLAAGRMFRKLWHEYHNAKLVALVYDEMVIEVPEGHVKEVSDLLAATMQESMQEQLSVVPAKAEGKVGSSWAAK